VRTAAALNVPAPQSMQVLVKAAPTVAEYFPAAQFKQVLAVVAPCVSEYVPAPQSAHVPVPTALLYFPAAHAVHGPPFDPVWPAIHSQLVLPANEFDNVGQLVQVLAVLPEYVPEAQLVQTVEAAVAEYLPASQSLHTEAPAAEYLPAWQGVR
jgi:hypothetical protein